MLNLFSYCPARSKERNKFIRSEDILDGEDDGIKERLMQDYGYVTFRALDYLKAYVTLSIENDERLPLKHWLVADSYRQLKKLGQLAAKVQLFFSNSVSLKRLSSGVLINDIIKKMSHHKDNDGVGKIKLYHYSTHDTNIGTLLDTLGLSKKIGAEMPKFGATILIELRRIKALHPLHTKATYTVKLLYLNNTEAEDNDLKELPLTGCLNEQQQKNHNQCTLDNFDYFTKAYQLTPAQWHDECGRWANTNKLCMLL